MITDVGIPGDINGNPQGLAALYRDNLGLNIEDWGGALIRAEGGAPPDGA